MTCEVSKVVYPTGCPDYRREQIEDRIETYETVGDALQDFWRIVVAECPEGDYMWLYTTV